MWGQVEGEGIHTWMFLLTSQSVQGLYKAYSIVIRFPYSGAYSPLLTSEWKAFIRLALWYRWVSRLCHAGYLFDLDCTTKRTEMVGSVLICSDVVTSWLFDKLDQGNYCGGMGPSLLFWVDRVLWERQRLCVFTQIQIRCFKDHDPYFTAVYSLKLLSAPSDSLFFLWKITAETFKYVRCINRDKSSVIVARDSRCWCQSLFSYEWIVRR